MAGETLQDLLDFTLETAWLAGKITLRYYQGGVQTEWKDDASPVTIADRQAEEKIRQCIEQRFPEDGLIGEEFGSKEKRSGRRWIIDPIDGTKSFVQGVPLYGVLIGVEEDDEMVAGVVYMPALDELVWAGKGLGCRWNGRLAKVSTEQKLESACLCFTSSSAFRENGREEAWKRLVTVSRMQRGWGDCYGHILVATGRAEACFDPIMNPWDCAPLLPILEEAGGSFTDWEGKPTIYGKDAFSTNKVLFADVMAQIKG